MTLVLAQLTALGDPGQTWHEESGGWTTESRAVWLTVFGDVRDRLLAGDADFEHLGHHLARQLDHDGIRGGPIAEEAAKLQRHLRDVWTEAL